MAQTINLKISYLALEIVLQIQNQGDLEKYVLLLGKNNVRSLNFTLFSNQPFEVSHHTGVLGKVQKACIDSTQLWNTSVTSSIY